MTATPSRSPTATGAGWAPVLAERPDAPALPDGRLPGRAASTSITCARWHRPRAAGRRVRPRLSEPGRSRSPTTARWRVHYANDFDATGRRWHCTRSSASGPASRCTSPASCARSWRGGRWGGCRRGDGEVLPVDRPGPAGRRSDCRRPARPLEMYPAMLGDCPVPWAVSVVGGDVVATGLAEAAVELGGHLHLGLEFFAGDRAPPTSSSSRRPWPSATASGPRRHLRRGGDDPRPPARTGSS